MKRLLSVALTVCAVFGLSRSVSGDLIIDDFSTPPINQQVYSPPDAVNGQVSSNEVAFTGGVGETRFLSVTRTGTSPTTPSGVNPQVSFVVSSSANTGKYDTGTLAIGTFTVGYDGDAADKQFNPMETGGLGTILQPNGLDFSTAGGLSLFASSDSGIALALTLYNGVTAFTSTFTVAADDPNGVPGIQEYFRPFNSFFGTGTLNLANIDAIKITNANPDLEFGQDVTFDLLKTSNVPEPGSMILLTLTGAGAAGAAWRRRRKQAAAA